MQSKGAGSISQSWMAMLCLASFVLGMFFTNRIWIGKIDAHQLLSLKNTASLIKEELHDNKEPCEDHKEGASMHSKDILGEVLKTHDAIRTLDSTISTLEMELAVSRSHSSSDLLTNQVTNRSNEAVKAFLVIGINTGFSSRKRRDAVRETWMPHGDKLRELEEKKGIVVRFIIGHSATPGSILDRAIDAENVRHGDFLRLNHIEGYHELPAKIKTFFSTAVAMWDADFYIKVDDDVHVNLGMLGSALAKQKAKPRVYIGCMKTGPVLSQKGMKYHEPEYWRFGEEGNKYFQHAAGQIYVLSKDLATYISINGAILHQYANEDVSLGSWLIGLDVEHIDDRNLCCGTPPDCELKAQAGTGCIASFDWACSGICKSAARLKSVHQRCGEGEQALRHLPDFRMLRHEKFSFGV